MNLDELRKMSNPYTISAQISATDFVGRNAELELLRKMLEGHKQGIPLKNIIISGEKAIGKSSLLNRYNQILQDYSFVVLDYEIPRGEIDEFEIIKQLINELYQKYSTSEDDTFSNEQSEIWFSLTTGEYTHGSDFTKRKIAFASKYASRAMGRSEKLSYKDLENDFKTIIKGLLSPELQFSGFAILIDEFQELARNPGLMDILRQLSERIPNLIIIGAGLPQLLDNASFEKIARSAESVNLKRMKRKDIIELILKPLQFGGKYTRHEVESCLNKESIHQIWRRSAGTPLDVQILCFNMFKHFQENAGLKFIELNARVMERAMEYYSTISEKSLKIKNSLETSSRDQLLAFSFLYSYEGYSLRAAILSEIAFQSRTKEKEEDVKGKFLDYFEDIDDLQLFNFSGDSNKLEEIKGFNVDRLANIQYEFIGDTVDRLYASYYYEDLVKKELRHFSDKNYDDLLAEKLGFLISNKITSSKIKQVNLAMDMQIQRVDPADGNDVASVACVKNELGWLVKSVDKDFKNDDIEKMKNLSSKYNLSLPSIVAHMFDFQGYYIIFSDVTIRGKKKRIVTFCPAKGDLNDFCAMQEQVLNVAEYIEEPLSDYFIEINSIFVFWMPQQPLARLFIIDINEVESEVRKAAKDRKFEKAVELAQVVRNQKNTYKEGRVFSDVISTNDYAFCLINVDSLDEAQKYLERIQDICLIAKINLAYVYYGKGEKDKAKDLLKKIYRKKLNQPEETLLIHLMIFHSEIKAENKLVEGLSYSEITCLNLALIYAQSKEDRSIVSKFLKESGLKENKKLIKQRVNSWIEYYYGDFPKAIEISESLLKELKQDDFLYKDVIKDIKIFRDEAPAMLEDKK